MLSLLGLGKSRLCQSLVSVGGREWVRAVYQKKGMKRKRKDTMVGESFLPPEIWRIVMRHLPIESVHAARTCSRAWRDLATPLMDRLCLRLAAWILASDLVYTLEHHTRAYNAVLGPLPTGSPYVAWVWSIPPEGCILAEFVLPDWETFLMVNHYGDESDDSESPSKMYGTCVIRLGDNRWRYPYTMVHRIATLLIDNPTVPVRVKTSQKEAQGCHDIFVYHQRVTVHQALEYYLRSGELAMFMEHYDMTSLPDAVTDVDRATIESRFGAAAFVYGQ